MSSWVLRGTPSWEADCGAGRCPPGDKCKAEGSGFLKPCSWPAHLPLQLDNFLPQLHT